MEIHLAVLVVIVLVAAVAETNMLENIFDIFFAMKTFERVMIIYFLLLFLFALLGFTYDLLKKSNKKSKYQLNTSKAAYVRAVMYWCAEHLGMPTRTRVLPEIQIAYYPNKSMHGIYFSGSKTIRVYVNNHDSLDKLTDTIIHEYVHYLDLRNSTYQKSYNKFSSELGYENNPFEINARKIASRNYKSCMRALADQGFLIKY